MKTELLKNEIVLPVKNTYIARDNDGDIWLYYSEKPHRNKFHWDIYTESLSHIKNSEKWPALDKLISWEDEPMLFDIIIRKQKRK